MTTGDLPKHYKEAACEGKHQFTSWEQAKRTLRWRAKNLEVYRCRCCGQYHVGHKHKGRGGRKPQYLGA